jgi:GTP-binding protein
VSKSAVGGSIDYRQAHYLLSAATLDQCPPDTAREVAFVGRSNAGKSSAINALTGLSKLARTSKTPGRTQLLNYFETAPQRYLVDLPGFGFAQVPLAIKHQWQQQLERYLEKRRSLQGLVLLMDIRHPFKELDELIIRWCQKSGLPLHVLLTKADKLTRNAANAALMQAQTHLKAHGSDFSIQLFSAETKAGTDELRAKLDAWLSE